MIGIPCVLSRMLYMLVDEQASLVNPLQALNTHKGFEFRTTETAAEAAAVTQHLPQGNWPDFRKGPLRPKIVRRDSRGMRVTAGVGGEGAERSPRRKKGGCAKSKKPSIKIGRKRLNGRGVTSE